MQYKLLFAGITSLFSVILPLLAQAQEVKKDSVLAEKLKKGKFAVAVRSAFISTINEGELTDYYAWGVMGSAKYESPSFKGFHFGFSGYFMYRLAASDLEVLDPIAKNPSRYEVGLFDIEHPNERRDLDGLEDLYLAYNFGKKHTSFLKAGNQFIKTPFLNPQDGRLRPTMVRALWGEFHEIKNLKLEGGWITHISPRSTIRWYHIAESIGKYPMGVNVLGGRGEYEGNITSKGIAIAGLTYEKKNNIKIQAWNTFVENLFNTAMVQADKDFPISEEAKFVAGVQGTHQFVVNKGGNEEARKAFFPHDGKSYIFSSRVGFENKKWITNLNYTRITKDGQFLFPREWGRDPFYTFIPRERNEGFADVQAFTVQVFRNWSKQLRTGILAGNYQLPPANDYTRNKYGMPSYYQINLNALYRFEKQLKGMTLELIYMYKGRTGDDFGRPAYVHNKVNMHFVNVVMNYAWSK